MKTTTFLRRRLRGKPAMTPLILLIFGLLPTFTAAAANRAVANPVADFAPAGITKVQAWLDGEVAHSKRTALMDFTAGEFFSRDTARLVGYIKGYNPRAGFTTGIVHAGNVITREEYSVVIQIHADGRFEGNIPMLFPEVLRVTFQKQYFDFYIQPGETLAMVLDWNEFLKAGKMKNTQYKFPNTTYHGVSAQINTELTAFNAQLPDLPYHKIYGAEQKREPADYKAFLTSITADYTNQFRRLLETENLSAATRKILQDSYKIKFALFLLDYEDAYGYANRDTIDHFPGELPIEFYDFLQEITNDKELLSTLDFDVFINRLEYAAVSYGIYRSQISEKGLKRAIEIWQRKDLTYLGLLKMPYSIVYDLTKVRDLESKFEQMFKNQREVASAFLTYLQENIADPFLKEEAERLFKKNYPLEKRATNELQITK
ncbi:hypothetical protein SAMD00024442_51_8 [Candidatus Symbiothrix dinenymphae]|nr:hypothetical protein SAMD00024442_51_8 [Candidatus Symbiothrix dinenymphae]